MPDTASSRRSLFGNGGQFAVAAEFEEDGTRNQIVRTLVHVRQNFLHRFGVCNGKRLRAFRCVGYADAV